MRLRHLFFLGLTIPGSVGYCVIEGAMRNPTNLSTDLTGRDVWMCITTKRRAKCLSDANI